MERTVSLGVKILIIVLSLYFLDVTVLTVIDQFRIHGLSQFVLVSIGLLFVASYLKKLPIPNIKTITLICFLLYLVWGIYGQVTPSSDFLSYYNSARMYASHPFNLRLLYLSKSPTTIVYYSFFIWLFGKSYLSLYIGSAIIWSVQLPLLYKALINFKFSHRTAIFSALFYGIAPGTIFFAPLISSEALFNCLILLSLFLLSEYKISKKMILLFYISIASGLLFLARSNGLFFFVGYLIYIFLVTEKCKLLLAKVLLISVVPFMLILSFQGFMNYHYGHNFSVLPSKWGSFNLISGTNKETKGKMAHADFALAGFGGENKVSWAKASRRARKIAYERIMEDPIGFVKMALTSKITRLWSIDTQNLLWGIRRSPVLEDMKSRGIFSILRVIIDAYYLVFLLGVPLFMLSVLAKKRTCQITPNILLLLLLPLAFLALLHVFIEVRPRFHVPFMPFIYVFAVSFWLERPNKS